VVKNVVDSTVRSSYILKSKQLNIGTNEQLSRSPVQYPNDLLVALSADGLRKLLLACSHFQRVDSVFVLFLGLSYVIWYVTTYNLSMS